MKCDVAFPIGGFTFEVIRPFPVDNEVTFELHNPEVFYDPNQHLERHQIKDIRILGVVSSVYGKDIGEIKSSAYQKVERAVNVLQFLVQHCLRTVDEVYFIRPLDDEGPVKIKDTINNGFRALGTVTAELSLDGLFGEPKFDAQKYMEDKLKPFDAVRPDRKDTLEKALSYYRIGVCAYNPFQAIESFFAAIQAIIMKEKPGVKRPSRHVRQYIESIIRKEISMTNHVFNDKFTLYWDNYRSDATHGEYHVNDYSLLREGNKGKYEVARWTRIVIQHYIKDSSKP